MTVFSERAIRAGLEDLKEQDELIRELLALLADPKVVPDERKTDGD